MNTLRVAAAALCLIGVSAAPALAQGPTFGVEAGVGLSRISPDLGVQSISRAPGGLVGVYVQAPLLTTIGLQIEAIYAQKHTHLSSTSDLKSDYFELPILAKLKVFKTIYLLEGVAFGFPVSSTVTAASLPDLDFKDRLKNPDISLVVGGGVPIGRFAIEGRYDGSFTNVFDPSGAAPQRNRSLSLIGRVHF